MEQDPRVQDKLNAALEMSKMAVKEICPLCKKTFEPTNDAERFCSQNCRSARFAEMKR